MKHLVVLLIVLNKKRNSLLMSSGKFPILQYYIP